VAITASAAIRPAVSLTVLLRFSLRSVRRFLLSCRFASVRYLNLSPSDTSRVRAAKNTHRARAHTPKTSAVYRPPPFPPVPSNHAERSRPMSSCSLRMSSL
jgi:hypothetical protein